MHLFFKQNMNSFVNIYLIVIILWLSVYILTIQYYLAITEFLIVITQDCICLIYFYVMSHIYNHILLIQLGYGNECVHEMYHL